MGRILAFALDEAVKGVLEGRARSMHEVFETLELEDMLTALEGEQTDVEVIVVGSRTDEPVRTVQRIFVVAPKVPVLVLVEQGRYRDVCKALMFAPFVGPHLRCVDIDGGAQVVVDAVQEAVAHLRKRESHRETIAALNTRLANVSPPTAPPSRAMLGGILDNAPIGVIVMDADGSIRAWNPRAGEIFGVREREALGLEFSVFLLDSEHDRWRRACHSILEHRHFVLREVFACDNGSERCHVDITATQLTDPERSVLILVQDVSERVRLLEELNDALRVRDEFLAVASHELKTPLTSVRLLVDSLMRSCDQLSLSKVKARAEGIDRSVTKLADLVDTLLDVSRIQQDRLDLERAEVDLRQRTIEVIERHRLDAERIGCSVRLRAPSRVVGHWDPARLDQVITNLLTNAFKYGAGKPVEVSIKADATSAILRIRDHGIGVPLELQTQIFERFERAVSSRHYGGLGLGLWIARQIVEAHGGRIELRSQPGDGATFEVRLPR